MKIISFDVKSRKVNFRQIFSNSSSLTYLFPPLPTIQGMIGAIMGYAEYTEILSKEVCKIGVMQLGGPFKTITTTYSYSKQFDGRGDIEGLQYADGSVKYFAPNFQLSTLKFQKLIDSGKREDAIRMKLSNELTALVPREWLISSVENEKIGYRIYFTHEKEEIVDELYLRVVEKNPYYSVSLGKAQSIATLENSRIVETVIADSNTVMTRMATNWEDIKEYYVRVNKQAAKKMMHARLPEVIIVHPKTNERIMKRMGSYYVEQNGKPYQITLKEKPLLDVETQEAVTWM